MSSAYRLGALIIIFCVILSGECLAISVTNTNDSGAGSLRAVIAAATGGDTIQFDPSLNGKTITLTSGELDITDAAKPLYIVGPGASQLTIKADTSSTFFQSVFHVASTATASISGLTITRGYNESIYNAGQLSITSCTISYATGVSGYGIYFDGHYGGTLAVTDCTVTNNNYDGIYFDATGGGALTVTNSTLSGNIDHGLEIWGTTSANMSCTVSGCTISGNTNAGVYVEYAHAVTITGTTISGNANSGIDDSYSALTINDCTIADNGAGTYNAAYNGGGIDNESGTLVVNDSTIALNSAKYYGGGIFQDQYNGSTTLANTIVAGNMNGNSPDIYGTVTANYCFIGNNTDPITMFTSGSGNNIVNQDALLAALGNYVGPTLTMALLPGSPAIDKGSNALIPSGLTTDQRELCRIANGRVDIGAYEYQPVVTGISPATGSTSGGTTVTITGIDLTGATVVNFGGTPATNVVVNSATQITATSPAGTAGTVHVTVVTPVGTSATSSADQFTYVVAPTVTGVSSTISNGSYKAGTVIPITVTFSQNVTVNTVGGTPSLSLNDGGTATNANGSGTSTLTFNYTVASGQNSADLDYASTSALALNSLLNNGHN